MWLIINNFAHEFFWEARKWKLRNIIAWLDSGEGDGVEAIRVKLTEYYANFLLTLLYSSWSKQAIKLHGKTLLYYFLCTLKWEKYPPLCLIAKKKWQQILYALNNLAN